MKNFFSKFFKKPDKTSKSIFSFEVINSIYDCLNDEQNSIEFKMKGIHDIVSVNLYTFPGSLNHDQAKAEIEKSGFQNPYQILNELYKKMDIGLISEEEILQELESDFIHFQFYSEPTPEVRKYLNYSLQNFIVFFCCINGSSTTNSYRILHTNDYFTDYTKALLEADCIDLNTPKNEIQKIGFETFELVLNGICQYLKIELPSYISISSDNLMPDEITIETFKEFIKLVSRGNVDEKLVQEQSKKLFEDFKEKDYHAKVEGHWSFFESIDCWSSDWKFDPEDAEYFVSEMIGFDLNFEYPEETYSHDLFPYIQSALEKHDLELMTYDTYGDSYLFFVANKNEVYRILELSEATGIEVNSL